MTKTIKKDIAKVNKLIHPKSRKAQQLNKKANRLDTRQKSKKFHAMKVNLIGEKLQWFKQRLIPNVKRYTGQMCVEIINMYLKRLDKELEQILIVHAIGKNRKNRRFASREDIIKMTILHEKEEFETCGLDVPDLMDEQQLEYLRNWNGELRYLQNFHLKRYTLQELKAKKDTLCPDDGQRECDDQKEESEEEDEDGEEESENENEGDDNMKVDEDEEDDSEWSNLSNEEGESKDRKIKTNKKKKTVCVQKKKKNSKRFKSAKELMDIDG